MKFIQKLNLLVEGIGASRNLYRLMPVLKIYKDQKFLKMADYLYGLKKLIQYINEEIEDHNKKAKIDISKLEIKMDYHESEYVKKEIKEVILNFMDDNLNNRDLFKKQLIKTLIKLFKDQNEYSDFYTFCEVNIKGVRVLIRTIDNKYNLRYINASQDIDYDEFIHDLVLHFFLNPKDVQKFQLDDKYDYDAIQSSRYTPSSILNELIALQNDFRDYKNLISDFIRSIKNDFKNFIQKSKIDNSNIKEQDFINKKFNEIFNLKNKILIQKLRNILLNDKDEDFNFDELKTISILLKNSTYKEYFKLTSDYYIDKIISNPRISNLSDKKQKIIDDKGNIIEEDNRIVYEVIERILMSIRYRKNKLSKNKNEPITWKDFRTYFRDYPYVLKLFPESKYQDNKIIFDDKNIKGGVSNSPELKKINKIFHDTIGIGQVLTKKSRTGTFDIENKEDKIDFIIERFAILLKNQFSDNSKYYALIDKELK